MKRAQLDYNTLGIIGERFSLEQEENIETNKRDINYTTSERQKYLEFKAEE